MYRAILFTTLIITLASCEGQISSRGHVYDKATRLPLDSVEAILIAGERDTISHLKRAFSNDSGYYEVWSGIIGMVFGVPEHKTVLFKNGYKPATTTNDSDIIFLERVAR